MVSAPARATGGLFTVVTVTTSGTLSRALDFGRAVQAGQLRTVDQAISLLKERFDVHARALCHPGELWEAAVDTTGGFDLGTVTLRSGDCTSEVLYQNESLLAWASDRAQPLCMAPDGICWFFEGDGDTVASNGDIVQADGRLNPAYQGRPVTLLGLAANPLLRVPGGLILDSFMQQVNTLGYRGPYVPVERLMSISDAKGVQHG